MIAELERVFRAPVVEAYGMTEAAHQMASNPLPPRARKPGTVGLRGRTGDPRGGRARAAPFPPDRAGEIVIRART